MKYLTLKDTMGDLFDAEMDAQHRKGTDLLKCPGFDFINGIDKTISIDDALTYCETTGMKENPGLPLWCYGMAEHLDGLLAPQIVDRLMDMASYDESGVVSRLEAKRSRVQRDEPALRKSLVMRSVKKGEK